MVYNDIKHVLPKFDLKGKYVFSEQINSGNINKTYHIVYEDGGEKFHYNLQRINKFVFKNPYGVMDNIAGITEHIKQAFAVRGEDSGRRCLQVINTLDGGSVYVGEDGEFWRVFLYIDNCTAYDTADRLELLEEAGRAFGEFQKLLSDFPAEKLFITIPDFHNTPKRYAALLESAKADVAGRAASAVEEIAAVKAHEDLLGAVQNRIDSGEIPLRVTHNDTKINNVLIDNDTDKALCVIDLDTVMPGSSLYDFGDAVRFACSTAAEDEPDTDKIHVDLDKFAAFARGYLSEAKDFLTDSEKALLVESAEILTLELAIRFLKDYLDGDVYFKIDYPEHNIVRTKAQLRLLGEFEAAEDSMKEIVRGILG